MDEATATAVLFTGTGISLLVWLLGARCYQRMRTHSARLSDEVAVKGKTIQEGMHSVLKMLASQSRILETTDDRVVFQLPCALVATHFTQETDALRIHTDAELTRGYHLMTRAMALLVFVVAPIVLVSLFGLLYTRAAASPSVNMRWQVLQIVQAVHVLWPPFLIAFVQRKLAATVRTFMSNIPKLIAVGL